MKLVILAAVAAIASPCPAFARGSPEIIVAAPLSPVALWSADMAERIDANLRMPRQVGPRPVPDGLVAITFSRDQAGHASRVTVVRSSGAKSLDLAAESAIERTVIPVLPDTVAINRLIQANLVFAYSQEEADSQVERFARERKASKIKMGETRDALVLTVLSSTSG